MHSNSPVKTVYDIIKLAFDFWAGIVGTVGIDLLATGSEFDLWLCRD